MSFIVEVPSAFSKSVQIPNRLGNTTLTGNETIHGGLVVNGSFTLGGTSNQNQDIIYNSLDISNNLMVRGNAEVKGSLDVSGINIYQFLLDISNRVVALEDKIIYIYMSFVVEIPSAFTKSVQIPNRLGNTTLTGNETIHGSVIVNGSLTLDGVGSNSGEPVYDSIKVTNDIEVGGNILSSRFRVDKIIDNLSGQFLDSSSPSNVTLAELIVYGGTLHMSFECGGSRTANGLRITRLY